MNNRPKLIIEEVEEFDELKEQDPSCDNTEGYLEYLIEKGLSEAKTIENELLSLLDIEDGMAISFLGDGLRETSRSLLFYYKEVLPKLINGSNKEDMIYLLEVQEQDYNKARSNILDQLEIKYGHLYK